MNYREVEVLAQTDLGASGTKIIDIDINDPISSMELIWRTKVATISDMTAEHVACISKIEVVDGSDVLLSMSGKQAQALAFYTQGVMPFNDISTVVGDYCTSVIPLYFGRYPFDPLFALNPKDYTNLQLRITYDEDVANASVTVNDLTVRANVFDEKTITPAGFFMSKEIKSYTPAASGYEYTDLPLDYPYRAMLFRSYSTDTDPFSVVEQVKLSEDHDKKIPFNISGMDVMRKIVSTYDAIYERVRLNEAAADSQTLYLAASYLQVPAIEYDDTAITASGQFAQATYASNKVSLAATVAIAGLLLNQRGYAPYSCFPLFFGDKMNPDDFYDVTNLGNLRLTTKGGSSVGSSPNMQVVVQQVRK